MRYDGTVNELGVYEAMRTLRAVRRLRPDPVPPAVLQRVIEAATWAPTGGNAQPWRVVVVGEPQRKDVLGRLYAERWERYVRHHRRLPAAVDDAAQARAERMMRAGDYLARHFGEVPVHVVFCFNPQHMAITDAALPRVSVVGGASIYPAVQNLLLACRAEGLGCVLTTLLCECEADVRALLEIPEPWATAAVVPIGYPVLRGHGPISRRPVAAMAFRDRWGSPLA
jgi:nitroreductase